MGGVLSCGSVASYGGTAGAKRASAHPRQCAGAEIK